MNSMTVTRRPEIDGGELPTVGGGADEAVLGGKLLRTTRRLEEVRAEIASSLGSQSSRE